MVAPVSLENVPVEHCRQLEALEMNPYVPGTHLAHAAPCTGTFNCVAQPAVALHHEASPLSRTAPVAAHVMVRSKPAGPPSFVAWMRMRFSPGFKDAEVGVPTFHVLLIRLLMTNTLFTCTVALLSTTM